MSLTKDPVERKASAAGVKDWTSRVSPGEHDLASKRMQQSEKVDVASGINQKRQREISAASDFALIINGFYSRNARNVMCFRRLQFWSKLIPVC